MNECPRDYCVYRYRNDSKRQICYVVAVNIEEADQLLESGSVAAVAHWDFNRDMFGEPETMKMGLPEAEARRWARYCDEEFEENRPIGFLGYGLIKIHEE